MVDRRHLIHLGSLELYKFSLEFLMAEWFDHALKALEIIRFWFGILMGFVKSTKLIVNILAHWLVLHAPMRRLGLVSRAQCTLIDFLRKDRKVGL